MKVERGVECSTPVVRFSDLAIGDAFVWLSNRPCLCIKVLNGYVKLANGELWSSDLTGHNSIRSGNIERDGSVDKIPAVVRWP